MALKNLLGGARGLIVTPAHEAYLMRGGNVLLPEQVVQFVISELTKPQRDRKSTFSASSASKCLRQQVLKFTELPEMDNFSTETNSIFIHGTWTHLKWQAMGLHAGWLKEVEVPCSIPELNITGTIDGILSTGDGWEFKTVNMRRYRLVMESGPLREHIWQVHVYMMATGIRRWSIVYESKDTQLWKEFIVEYDEELAGTIRDEYVRANDHLRRQELPDILDKCLEGTGTVYRQCPFNTVCLGLQGWPTPRRIRFHRPVGDGQE